MGIFLGFIATVLNVLLYIIDFIRVLIVNIKRSSYLKKVDKQNFTSAFQVDIFSNYQYKDTFNWMFCKKDFKYFGRFGESLSSVFGKARKNNTLNVFGIIISYILDVLWYPDWFKGGHCKASIMSEKTIKENQLKFLR